MDIIGCSFKFWEWKLLVKIFGEMEKGRMFFFGSFRELNGEFLRVEVDKKNRNLDERRD